MHPFLKNLLIKILVLSFILIPYSLFLIPLPISAQSGLVVCDDSNDPANPLPSCDFYQLIEFIKNLINFLILIAVPLAAISFAYAGFLLIFSGGSETKKEDAKKIFSKTAFGFMFVLAAWLIVRFISAALLEPGISFV